ncbi:tabinhibitin 3-like isoform X1 [Drosophila albomicans]|uniref:Tabinhibitin 3-like isoform X1 n=1 Tax=Drosophila albomicans TaxID=7291 RepID=A0A9C6T2Q0_DROAB|nr:tabinhibitin 3-like isoform X1 [Drosophila albomicans]
MHIQLAMFILCTAVIDQLYSMRFFEAPIFKTKVSKYKLRTKLVSPTPPQNYCRKGLCPANVKHIACGNPFWGSHCEKPRAGVNVEKIKTDIIDVHNNIRENMSKVSWQNLPIAKGLPKVKWNQDLSVLAMRITNYCNNATGMDCVNTPRFLHVGRSSTDWQIPPENSNMKPEDFLILAIKYIGGNFLRVNASFVESFPSDASNFDYAFANIINQRANEVGCGMMTRKPGRLPWYYITCLYDTEVKPGQKLYDF